ncbi:transporter substrate-binding domain-containing protein [Vibrio mexicanus]|uniref:transporter substrate-binding domain-containing protein n=1 Tax=Vibrio mexicanus TaxID=1004326 RepID=UPI000AB7583F|nr:transporter substrate-binding domain-containing protein [Vibrio mexicanus]
MNGVNAKASLLILPLIPLMAAHATNDDTLSNTRILTVTNSKAWKPFSYISETGEPSGILVDFWNAYSRNNNVQIEFLLLDWNESINAVKDGRADVHGGLLFSSPRDEFLDFGNDIIVIDTQLYISQRLIGTDVNFFLTGVGNRGVGVVTGGMNNILHKTISPSCRWLSLVITRNLCRRLHKKRLMVSFQISKLQTSICQYLKQALSMSQYFTCIQVH